MQSYVAPWACELAYVGRHDVQPQPCSVNDWVHVRDADSGQLIFRGNIVQISPGGVADEGIDFIAQGRRFRLENEPVNINGSGVYVWNPRGHLCSHGSGEDSPGRDGGKWTAGEIIIDILEHALGLPDAGSDIPGHHSCAGCVTDTYLTTDDILSYDASDWLALDSVIGEFSVDNTPVAVAISELLSMNGGFYGWYIDPYGVLRLHNLNSLPETDVEAGELGQWQDAGGTAYSLLDNRLDWSLDGVYSEVMVQGTDRTVEVKPANLDGCANAALNGGGELELVNQPWKDWDCAYRALEQPYRPWTWKPVGFSGSCENWRDECECGIPAGLGGVYSGARIYRGTDAGAKGIVNPPMGGFNWRVNLRTGIVMFYWDVAADLDPGEKLWGWYWARQPFTVTAGPSGNAYVCLGYQRTLKVFDPAYRHTTSWPQEGQPDDETAMGILAGRLLEQLKDVRVQGRIECDGVDASLTLQRRYNVTRLAPFTTEAPPTSTPAPPTTTSTTEACWPDPLDWGRLALNAVEVTWDFSLNTVELTLANTFFMLEGYSAIKERLRLNLFAEREFGFSEDIVDCQVGPGSGSEDDEVEDCRPHTGNCYSLDFTDSCGGTDYTAMDAVVVSGASGPESGSYWCLWENGTGAFKLGFDPVDNEWFVVYGLTATGFAAKWVKAEGVGPVGTYNCSVGGDGIVVVAEVECPSTTTVALPTTTTTTLGDCNACDPAIPDTLHVTLCGLAGDLAPYNGDHTLTYVSYCLWRLELEDAWIELAYSGASWIVTLNVTRGTSCRKRWIQGDIPGCTPQSAFYVELDCLDDTCADHESCEDSIGATCEVSDAGASCPTTSTTTEWCEDCRALWENCYRLDFAGECGDGEGGACANGNWDGLSALVEWSRSESQPEGFMCLWQGLVEAQDSDCHGAACGPLGYDPMRQIIIVSLRDLERDFAPYNGEHCVRETGPCEWAATLADGTTLRVYWDDDASSWFVELVLSGSIPPVSGTTSTTPGDACAIRWESYPAPAEACAVVGEFRLDHCWNDACADNWSCAYSTGARCTVYSGLPWMGLADLTYHPAMGWMILVGEAVWTKDDDPFDFCDPEGAYSCAGDGGGTVTVTQALCPGVTTTTTAAPTTTTAAPPPTTTAAPTTSTTTEAPPACPDDCSVCDDDNTVTVTVTNLAGTCGGFKKGQCWRGNQVVPLVRDVGTDCRWYATQALVLFDLYCSDNVWYLDIHAANTCVRFTAAPLGNGCPPTAAGAWTADAGYSTCDVGAASMSLSWD